MAMVTPNTEMDYSGGGTTWHGTDFNHDGKVKGVSKSDAYKQYYEVGFKFTETSHDIWNMGSHSNPTKINRACGKKTVSNTVDYKFESTGAAGGSIFLKRTGESINAERKACDSNYKPSNGRGVW